MAEEIQNVFCSQVRLFGSLELLFNIYVQLREKCTQYRACAFCTGFIFSRFASSKIDQSSVV